MYQNELYSGSILPHPHVILRLKKAAFTEDGVEGLDGVVGGS